MLMVNFSVTSGLVNAAMGTITHISKNLTVHGLPKFISIKFDHPQVGQNLSERNCFIQSVQKGGSVSLCPYKERIMMDRKEYVRHQYPLQLCWAITIHKTQGMTRDVIGVQFNGIFRSGMAYVALSRVTTLDGLYLKD